MKILIINNDNYFLNELKTYYKDDNSSICNIKNINNTRELINNNSFEIIIFDLDYFSNNAQDIFKYITSKFKGAIIVISNNNKTDIIVEYFSLGADDYVIKPFSTKELVMRIRVVYNRKIK